MNKRIFIGVLMLLFAYEGYAAYAVDITVSRIRSHGNGYTYVNTAGAQPAQTCSNWNAYFKYDHTTETGKQYSSILIAAMAAGRKIDIWYNPSTAIGSDQSNGCDDAAVSDITGVALK